MPSRRLTRAAAIAILVAAGCRAPAETEGRKDAPPPPIRVADDLGRTVSLGAPAARMAVLSPGFVETMFAIGCGGKIILRDLWSDHPSPAFDRIPKVDGVQVSVRAVAGFSPDLTILYADDGRVAESFDRIGAPLAVLHPDTYDEVAADAILLGRLCGREAAARDVAAAMRRAREEVGARVRGGPRPTVYVEIEAADPARPWTAGRGSFVDELVTLAGGANAAPDLPSAYSQVSAEAIIRAQPDFVLVLHRGLDGRDPAVAIRERPGWSALRAAQEGRVIAGIDDDLLSRPGPRLADGLRALAAALHPPTVPDGGIR